VLPRLSRVVVRDAHPGAALGWDGAAPAMFALVLIAIVIAVAARLAIVISNDRSLSPPRSHAHELDGHSARLHRAS